MTKPRVVQPPVTKLHMDSGDGTAICGVQRRHDLAPLLSEVNCPNCATMDRFQRALEGEITDLCPGSVVAVQRRYDGSIPPSMGPWSAKVTRLGGAGFVVTPNRDKWACGRLVGDAVIEWVEGIPFLEDACDLGMEVGR